MRLTPSHQPGLDVEPARRRSAQRPCPGILQPWRRRRSGGASLAGLLCLALLSACQDDTPAPVKTPELVKVQAVRFEPLTRTISLTGTVAARVESELSFRTGGRIADRKVDVGDHVKAGDVLATIETQEQEADVQSAKATLQAAEATLVQQKTNYDRQKQLLDSGFTTKSTFDTAQEQLRTAQSSLDSARADVGTAEDQLSFTVLKADSDGIITARNAEAGQVVSAAQTVFTLARDGARDAVFDIYEALLAEAPTDNGIEVRLLSNPAVTATATVREVSPTFDTATGTVRVKTSLIDPPDALGLGAAVSGIGHMQPKRLVGLPWTALTAGAGGAAVWVVDPQTKAVTARKVTIDRYRTGQILVRDGLKDGDLVVTAGGQFLHDGQTVSIASGEAS